MDFGDLKDDKVIQDKLHHFNKNINKIEKLLKVTLEPNKYKKLSTEDKVNYDLFMTYTLNTLYWLYLRTKGLNPNQTDVKNQFNRIKQYMAKAKETHDRNTIRPRLNQQIAKRFIKHGIHQSSDQGKPPTKIGKRQ
ncbi:hypothetical protein FQA39_LY15511 [Lamprigera yunnana]|nr:hypothetical protein FQA39_LY15511 [Lamprigera yunnana]